MARMVQAKIRRFALASCAAWKHPVGGDEVVGQQVRKRRVGVRVGRQVNKRVHAVTQSTASVEVRQVLHAVALAGERAVFGGIPFHAVDHANGVVLGVRLNEVRANALSAAGDQQAVEFCRFLVHAVAPPTSPRCCCRLGGNTPRPALLHRGRSAAPRLR